MQIFINNKELNEFLIEVLEKCKKDFGKKGFAFIIQPHPSSITDIVQLSFGIVTKPEYEIINKTFTNRKLKEYVKENWGEEKNFILSEGINE